MNNANERYWTMSPSRFSEVNGEAGIFTTTTNGSFGVDSVYSRSIRPVLVLRSDIQIISGDGTQSNPYVVQ